jgi:hypothetical protein
VNYIADSGFIVARWSKSPKRQQWATKLWERARLPMLTSAANLQEAGWLLDNHEIVLRMVRDGDLLPALDFDREAGPLHALARKYAPRMDVADAAIVRLSELHPGHEVLTVDREDFGIYRRNGSEIIPCNFGPPLQP